MVYSKVIRFRSAVPSPQILRERRRIRSRPCFLSLSAQRSTLPFSNAKEIRTKKMLNSLSSLTCPNIEEGRNRSYPRCCVVAVVVLVVLVVVVVVAESLDLRVIVKPCL